MNGPLLETLSKHEIREMRDACRRIMNRVPPERMRQWCALLNTLDNLLAR